MKRTRRQRLEDYFGPVIYTSESYTPTHLRIPLDVIARQMKWDMPTLDARWVRTGILVCSSHFGSKQFSTKRHWERACVSSGLVPRPATVQIYEGDTA